MTYIPHQITSDGTNSNVTVVIPGEGITPPIHHSHPSFKRLTEGLIAQTITLDEVRLLMADESVILERFKRLSDKVEIAQGRVFFEGAEVHGAISDLIVRMIGQGEDVGPIVAFLEKSYENPNEASREAMFDWASTHKYTITQTGNLVGYKGFVALTDEEKAEYADKGYTYKSVHGGDSYQRGHAFVNGDEQHGQIYQGDGDVVTMPRETVVHDPGTWCSTGLHVGTHEFATGYGTVMAEVLIHPADIVSIPSNHEGSNGKFRTCGYVVVGLIDGERVEALRQGRVPNEQDVPLFRGLPKPVLVDRAEVEAVAAGVEERTGVSTEGFTPEQVEAAASQQAVSAPETAPKRQRKEIEVDPQGLVPGNRKGLQNRKTGRVWIITKTLGGNLYLKDPLTLERDRRLKDEKALKKSFILINW